MHFSCHNHYLFAVLLLLLCLVMFLFLSDETVVDRLSKLQVTTRERVAPDVAYDIATNNPHRWIHIIEFSEGMSAWMLSLTEVLLAARTLNATLVEPCVQQGRLVSCGIAPPNATRLHHLFNMTLLKKLHPYIASYQDFQSQTVGARTFPACMQRRTTFPAVSKFCGNVTTCHKDEQCKQVEDAILEYGPSVLEIQWYTRGGFGNTKVGTHKLIPLPGRAARMQLKTQYVKFKNEHYAYVNRLLETAGIGKDSFSVVHWRAELQGMNYLSCAQDVVNSRKLMDPKNSSQFILMSSLNTKKEYMWKGTRKKAGRKSSNAPEALQFLLDNGFAKLDTLIAEDVSDPSILAVYDLILAMKAQNFATCARVGGCESTVCAKCNHQGKFADLAIELRDTVNKTSLACWPE